MRYLAIIMLLLTVPAYAQSPTPPDVVFMQQAITTLQAQRNKALDDAAVIEAQMSKQIDELKKQIADLKDKYEHKNGGSGQDVK